MRNDRAFPGSSSPCNAGDPGLNPGSGRFAGEGISYPLQYCWTSLVAHQVKNQPVMRGLIPGWGRSPGEENGYPLQYSGLENSMECIVHGNDGGTFTYVYLNHFAVHLNLTQHC